MIFVDPRGTLLRGTAAHLVRRAVRCPRVRPPRAAASAARSQRSGPTPRRPGDLQVLQDPPQTPAPRARRLTRRQSQIESIVRSRRVHCCPRSAALASSRHAATGPGACLGLTLGLTPRPRARTAPTSPILTGLTPTAQTSVTRRCLDRMAVLPLPAGSRRGLRYTEHVVSEVTSRQQVRRLVGRPADGSAGSGSPGSSSPCSSLAGSPSPSSASSRSFNGALAIFSFALPSRQAKVTYKEQQLALRRALKKAPGMEHGASLATLEKGVLFPVVHVCDSGSLFQNYIDSGHMLAEDSLGPDYVLYQGCYQEVRCIAPEGEDVAAPPFDQPGDPRDYLLLGFKTVEESFSQVLEDTWKDWTGARHIYLFLPDVLGLERISLYRRVEPDHMQLFKYLVLARLGPSPGEGHAEHAARAQEVLLDYAQRLRVHRITAYLSVYRSFPREESNGTS